MPRKPNFAATQIRGISALRKFPTKGFPDPILFKIVRFFLKVARLKEADQIEQLWVRLKSLLREFLNRPVVQVIELFEGK